MGAPKGAEGEEGRADDYATKARLEECFRAPPEEIGANHGVCMLLLITR